MASIQPWSRMLVLLSALLAVSACRSPTPVVAPGETPEIGAGQAMIVGVLTQTCHAPGGQPIDERMSLIALVFAEPNWGYRFGIVDENSWLTRTTQPGRIADKEKCIYGRPFAVAVPVGTYLSLGWIAKDGNKHFASNAPVLAPLSLAEGQVLYVGRINLDAYWSRNENGSLEYPKKIVDSVSLEWNTDRLYLKSYYPGFDTNNVIVPSISKGLETFNRFIEGEGEDAA